MFSVFYLVFVELRILVNAKYRVKAQKETADAKEAKVGAWKNSGSLYYLDSPAIKPSKKIASFDMDDTLIETKYALSLLPP